MSDAWFGEHPQRSIVAAGAWATVANLASAALTIVGTVTLSRLLSPSEIGLFTLSLAFYSLPSLVVGPGLTAAAVQTPHLTRQQSSNLFWINVAINAAMGLLLVAASPAIAAWFDQPALRLICLALAVVLVLEGMATQYRALLTRAMRFDVVAKVGLLVGCVSLSVGILLAFLGFGVWALVTQLIVAATVDRVVIAAVVPWRPSWFDRHTSVGKMLRFSFGSSLSLVMHAVYTQSQSLLMGRFATIDNVGYYSRGQALFQKPFTQITGPLHAVLLPALSSKQRNPEELGSSVYRANAVLFALLPPLAVWMMMSSTDIAVSLLGKAWQPAGDVLFWFALTAIPGILFGTLYKSNEAIGKPTWGLGIRAAFLPVLLGGLVWAAPRGAAAMAAIGTAVEWASAPVIFWLLLKESPVPKRFYVGAMGECLATIGLTALCMWPTHTLISRFGMPASGRAIVSLVACYTATLLLIVLFPFGRAAWSECATLARHGLQRLHARPVSS